MNVELHKRCRFAALGGIRLAGGTNTDTPDSLLVADVGEGAVERDPVADVDVEAVFSVGLVDPVGFCQRERLPLFTITWQTQTHTGQ